MATGDGKPPSLDADVDMADLASLDGPASSSIKAATPSTRFRPKVKGKAKPKPPKPEPEPKAEPELKPEAKAEPSSVAVDAPPNDGVDAMEVDGVGAGAGAGADLVGDEEEEEDFVVREIDVYFTPEPFDKDAMLYIMQYPLRPSWRPYELNEICEEVRVKPRSSKVEVDLAINTESNNYDSEVSTPFKQTKQTLSSSKAADVADYAVGVLKGNLLHLNHIDAVMQLRPSMSHLNSSRSHIGQSLQLGETNCSTSGPTGPSVKGKECMDDTEESEPWISLAYEPEGSTLSSKYHAKMVSNDGGPIDFNMSISDYVTSLCPGGLTSNRGISKSDMIRKVLSLPLEVRLTKWLTEVSQVNRFDALMHLAPTYSEEDFLKELPKYADLVRGLWVCKSSLLFDDDGYAFKRDRILLEFMKRDSIPMKVVDSVIKMSDPMSRRILTPFCKRFKHDNCKFIEEADSSFIKRYPHIVKDQEHAWSVREKTMPDSRDSHNTQQRKTNNPTRSNIPSRGADPNMSKVRDGAVKGSENYERSVLDTIFTANKVRSTKAVVRDLRQLAAKYASDRKDGSKFQALANAAKNCASFSDDELKASICNVAVPVHHVFVAKTATKNTVRNVLIMLFRERDPTAALTKQEILNTAKKVLKREIDEKEYHQAVNEICISNEDGNLILKNGDEP